MSESLGSAESRLIPDPRVPDLRGADALDEPLGSRWSYEVTVAEIEGIMARIESGDLELAEVFDQFAVAVEYLRQCETFLNQRQQQMDILIETLTDDPDTF